MSVAATEGEAEAPLDTTAEEEKEEASAGSKGDEVLYFGGIAQERAKAPEETEPMRVASRINQALAARRLPREVPLAFPAERGWYDELGVAPTATQAEITVAYLERASEVEQRLAYLLEGAAEGEESEPSEDLAALAEGSDAVDESSRSDSEASLARLSAGEMTLAEDGSEYSEPDKVALEFMRASNLYQILSVPRLRKIYDEGGVEGLAMRVPRLHKGLLDPERVVAMARGITDFPEEKESLLLRKVPRQATFFRYQAANSIRQVLRRMTDVFRVWIFNDRESLNMREGTIYTELPEICLLGRVNSGKSAVLQHLLSAGGMKRNQLANVGQKPGKTKGLHTFCVNRRFTVTDSPGYGGKSTNPKAQTIQKTWQSKWQPLVEDYLNKTHWLRAVVYVHDIAKDVTEEDIAMVRMLRQRKLPVLLLLTKDDKVDSDTHRLSRAKDIRTKLKWPLDWPHTYYTTRPGGYGQTFKNILGTMMLGLLATDNREDAMYALRNELPEVFMDYRDKYVPRPRGPFGRLLKEKKVRTYPYEDKVYTDDDLRREEKEAEKKEKMQIRRQQRAAGYVRTTKDDIEEEAGVVLTQKQRRQRWEEMLAESTKR